MLNPTFVFKTKYGCDKKMNKKIIILGAVFAAILMLVTPNISAMNSIVKKSCNEYNSGIFPSGLTGVIIMQNFDQLEITNNGQKVDLNDLDINEKYNNIQIKGKLGYDNSFGVVINGLNAVIYTILCMFVTRPIPVITFLLKINPGFKEYTEGDSFNIHALSAGDVYYKQDASGNKFVATLIGYSK